MPTPIMRLNQSARHASQRRILLFNKPYGVLCQFSADGATPTLADYIDAPGFYPAGRLDKDSEGLLLLTDDGRLQHQLTHPKKKTPKTYWVQVEGDISSDAFAQLAQGLTLKDGKTRPAQAKRLSTPETLWPRTPPVRFRKHIPTSWIALTITEGRNRQVRRMTAAAGFPTLRLIRHQIGRWRLDDLQPGDYRMCQHNGRA